MTPSDFHEVTKATTQAMVSATATKAWLALGPRSQPATQWTKERPSGFHVPTTRTSRAAKRMHQARMTGRIVHGSLVLCAQPCMF